MVRRAWPARCCCAMKRRKRCMKSAPRIRSSLFWDVTRRRLAFIYLRCWANYQSHFQGSSSLWRLDRYVVPKRRLITTNLRRVTSQRSGELIVTAAEAWSRASTPQSYKTLLCLAKTDLTLLWVQIVFRWRELPFCSPLRRVASASSSTLASGWLHSWGWWLWEDYENRGVAGRLLLLYFVDWISSAISHVTASESVRML